MHNEILSLKTTKKEYDIQMADLINDAQSLSLQITKLEIKKKEAKQLEIERLVKRFSIEV